jgi:pimeloyl-ACP methyl ester carboxylesterase
MPEFTTDDRVRLHYVECGNGPLPIIYLHWAGGEVANWDGLWSEMDAVRFRHVALDFRGHGRSQQAPSAFTSERLARDALQLADELGIHCFVVIGHSFGGKIALKIAAMAPQRIRGLVLLGAVGPGKVSLERDVVEAILSRAGEIAFVRDCFRSWFSVWPRAEIDRSLEAFARTPVWALRASFETALWEDITSDATLLTPAALVLTGEHDPVYGPPYQRSAVLSALRHAELHTVDCGHGMYLERPAEIAVLCEQFVESLASKAEL